MATGQPWGKAMSFLLRPLETTQATTIVICKRGEEEPERLMLLAHGLESCWGILWLCVGKEVCGNLFSQFISEGCGRGMPSSQMQGVLIILMDKAPENLV